VKLLLNGDFSTTHRTTAKEADFALGEGDDAIAGGVNREVTAHLGADAGAFGHADLTDDNLAGFNRLATKQLDAEALTGTIVDIFGGTASFDM
jgi:hypothetical protein